MIFYYIRHGDPIYSPNSLTPLGQRQAEAVAKRLALYGLDKIYSSPSNRAVMTATPTCELLKMEPELLDFADEAHAWRDFTIKRDGKTGWLFYDKTIAELFLSKEIRDLGDRWYEHPMLAELPCGHGIRRVYDEMDAFFAELGFEHERYTGRYKVTKPNEQRIALFAHQGFSMAFLSCLLDIPYPAICMHFDMTHTGMTVIEFADNKEYCSPRVLTLSSDAHLYREGLPTKYNNGLYI